MLDKDFTIDQDSQGFNMTMKLDNSWNSSKRRVLIIVETVDSADLNAETMASTPAMVNAIKYARSYARRHNPDLPDFAFGVTNFNSKKHLHLRGHQKAEAESEFKARQMQIIKRLKPTHILFSGDINKMWHVDKAPFKNGWVHEFDGMKVTSTLDFGRLMDKQGMYANLLGFWCRHLANLLLGYNPFDLKDVKAKPVVIDTMAKFKKVCQMWDRSERVAVDTETKNLSVTANAIYTIQFAFKEKPDRGYVIPIDHPHEDNPFSEEERVEIKRMLRKRFGARKGPELVTFNGTFDIRILRQALKLNIIYLTVWEIMAGEHLLDENVSSMASLGIRAGGLAAVYCAYGNDFYLAADTTFSKEDRSTIGSISPLDEGFLMYGATDTVSILHIADMQVYRAGFEVIGQKPYTKFFERHMRYQMSATVHVLSHLKQEGSFINKDYLRGLMRPDSVLAKAIAELDDEFKTFPEVVKANKLLLDDSGFKAGSLFGSAGATASRWMFSFTKSAHKLKLFIEVCGLKPVSKTPTGEAAIDKEFIEHYKDRNYLVAKFGDFQVASKLLSTYIKGWYKQLTREIDGATDSHLRPDYSFFDVDTGRLACKAPNLQNIPTRGKLSKIIKEMFITEDGHLLVRFDYSAHEVRGWAIASSDSVLASVFQVGQRLRKLFIRLMTPDVNLELNKRGWSLPLTPEQRAQVKAEIEANG